MVFVDFIEPPGSAATAALEHFTKVLDETKDTQAPVSTLTSDRPTFMDALLVRCNVFVDEQQCLLANEVDADDTRSYHWVVRASEAAHSNTSQDNQGTSVYQRVRNEGGLVPVGTIRLVPPPHDRHPLPGSADGKGGDDVSHRRVGNGDIPTKFHDGIEPYVKLGRLATVKHYRKLGLGKLLVNQALAWAVEHRDEIGVGPMDPIEREKVGARSKSEVWRGLVMLHAQVTVVKFYQSLGFEVDEELGRWYEEGIEHVAMWKRLSLSGA